MCATSQYGRNCSNTDSPPITYTSSDLYDATFSSASSTECTTTTPSFLYDKSLVSTTLYLSIRAVLSVICSYVFLPIIAAFPAVSIRKSLISSGILTRRCPCFPIAQFLSTVAIRFIITTSLLSP